MTCRPGSLAPVTQAEPGTTRGSSRYRIPVGPVGAEHAGPDVALDQRRVALKSSSANGLDLGRGDLRLQPLEVDLAVTGQADGQRLAACRPGAAACTSTFFSVSPAAHGRSARGNRSLLWSTSVSMVGVSGVSSTCAAGSPSIGRASGTGVMTASTFAA